jgi:hypothetical protein
MNKSRFIAFSLISWVSIAQAADFSPADVDLFCSGMLLRTSGLLEQNSGNYPSNYHGTFNVLSKHLNNNGMLLMQRGMANGGDKKHLNTGMGFANEKIGSNLLAVITKDSNPHKAVMDCLKRSK